MTQNVKADDSRQILRAKRKLKQQLEIIDRQMTPSSLNEATERMQQWLQRNCTNRISLDDGSITYFDENQNSAPVSQEIEQFTQDLKSRLNLEAQSLSSLAQHPAFKKINATADVSN